MAEDPLEIWPENEVAFELFLSLRSQWLVGMAGATGLNYGVLFHKMDRMELTPERYDELESQVRVLEYAALNEMNRK